MALLVCEGAQAYDVSDQEFDEIHRVTQTIVKQFPPDKYYYLGIGRSPAPILAVLQSAIPGSASQLPLTGFNYSEKGHPESPSMNSRQTAALESHFERFLPTPEQLKGRKILLIDYSRTGQTLVSAEEYITEFGFMSDRDYDIDILSLNDTDRIPELQARAARDGVTIHSVPLDSAPEFRANLHGEIYRLIAEYGEFDLAKKNPGAALKRNPEYDAFKASVAKKLAAKPLFPIAQKIMPMARIEAPPICFDDSGFDRLMKGLFKDKPGH